MFECVDQYDEVSIILFKVERVKVEGGGKACIIVKNTDITYLDALEDSTDDVAPDKPNLLALPPSDFRATRCQLANELQVPATADEKLCWDKSVIPDHSFPSSVNKDDCGNDFEDPLGYYTLLGCSKTSSDSAIAAAYQDLKSKHRETSLALHPDKNSDPTAHEALKTANSNWELVCAAYHVLGFCDDDNNYPARVQYDKDGEMIREAFKFEFNNIHNGESFTARAKILRKENERHKVYEKREQTNSFRKDGKGKFVLCSYHTLSHPLICSFTFFSQTISESILDTIVRHWATNGQHAQNKLRALVCMALDKKIAPADIARYVRGKVRKKDGQRFDGIGAKDKEYQAMLRKIGRIRKDKEEGRLDHILKQNEDEMNTKQKTAHKKTLNSKTVVPNARGRKVLDHDDETEKKLYEQLQELWAGDKRVSRVVVFRLVLDIDPMFKVSGGPGGKGSAGHWYRLQTWFYFGFNRRYNLSNRKLASIGQKLPVDWEEHLRRLQERVARQQFPHTMNIGTEENPQMVAVPGIEDDHWINFDHVPVWIEGVGNHSWGPRDSGRRNVKTGGKEKNRFTVVLTITKNGKKGIPFIIFKGMLYVYSVL